MLGIAAAFTAAVLFGGAWFIAGEIGSRQTQLEDQQTARLTAQLAAHNVETYLTDTVGRTALAAAPIRRVIEEIQASDSFASSLHLVLQQELERNHGMGSLAVYRNGEEIDIVGADDALAAEQAQAADLRHKFISSMLENPEPTQKLFVFWPPKDDGIRHIGRAFIYTAVPVWGRPNDHEGRQNWIIVSAFSATDLFTGAVGCPHPRCSVYYAPEGVGSYYAGNKTIWLRGAGPIVQDNWTQSTIDVSDPVPGRVISVLESDNTFFSSLLVIPVTLLLSGLIGVAVTLAYVLLSRAAARKSGLPVWTDPITAMRTGELTNETIERIGMFRLLIDANMTPILVADSNLGTIAYANPAATSLLAPGSTLSAKPIERLFRLAPDNLNEYLGKGGEAQRVSLLDPLHPGYVDLRFGPAKINDRQWTMIVVSDASAAMQAEQQSRQAREQLDQAMKRRLTNMGDQYDNMRRMVQALRNFNSTLAHEIKNPIAIILVAAQNILASEDPDVIKRAKRIIKRAEDMNLITNRVLTSVRMEANAISPSLDQANPLEIVAKHVSTRADFDNGHSYVMKIEKVETKSLLDQELFSLVLTNVLHNAEKYSPRGSKITISGTEVEKKVIIRVADEGIGVPDSEKTKIFTNFYRASTAKKAGIPGNGLGMAICKEIIEKLGGTIHLEDTPGGGTTVVISIPVFEPIEVAA